MRLGTWILLALAACHTTTVLADAPIVEWIRELMPPENQGAERDSRRFTVGVPLSDPYNLPGQVQVRLTPGLLLGGSYVGTTGDEGIQADTYELKSASTDASFYVEFYPVKKSGFHLGAGIERVWGTYRAELKKDGSLALDGDFDAVYGGPSFGWSWLWSNGVTLGFDLSQRKRFAGNLSAQVDQTGVPADLKSTVQSKLAPATASGTIILGYSF